MRPGAHPLFVGLEVERTALAAELLEKHGQLYAVLLSLNLQLRHFAE